MHKRDQTLSQDYAFRYRPKLTFEKFQENYIFENGPQMGRLLEKKELKAATANSRKQLVVTDLGIIIFMAGFLFKGQRLPYIRDIEKRAYIYLLKFLVSSACAAAFAEETMRLINIGFREVYDSNSEKFRTFSYSGDFKKLNENIKSTLSLLEIYSFGWFLRFSHQYLKMVNLREAEKPRSATIMICILKCSKPDN